MPHETEDQRDGPPPDDIVVAARAAASRPGLAHDLDQTPPGPRLAALLDGIDPDDTDLYDRVELVAAAGRLESWAHRIKARAAGAVDRHPDMRPHPGHLPPGQALVSRRITAATLAMRLQASPRETDALVREGRSYDSELAATGDALADGTIDAPRARVLVDRLWDQPTQVAVEVEALVLPDAGGRTPTQLRRDVEDALVRVDGAHAAERHVRAREDRHVGRPVLRPDGMAGLWLLLPAVDAIQVDAALDAAAHTARAAQDPRTHGQLRADTLRDLVVGTHTPATPGSATTPRPTRARVLITMSLSTLLAQDDEPAELAGYGPVDAVQARALALGGDLRRMLLDPRSGAVLDVGRTRYRPPAALVEHVRRRDRWCAVPGCRVPAERSDLDPTIDYHRRPGKGTTSAKNLGPLCPPHHRLKTEARFVLRQPEPGLFEMTTPSGHTFRARPGTEGPSELLPRTDTGRPVDELGAGTRPGDDEAPPF